MAVKITKAVPGERVNGVRENTTQENRKGKQIDSVEQKQTWPCYIEGEEFTSHSCVNPWVILLG